MSLSCLLSKKEVRSLPLKREAADVFCSFRMQQAPFVSMVRMPLSTMLEMLRHSPSASRCCTRIERCSKGCVTLPSVLLKTLLGRQRGKYFSTYIDKQSK